ncbi:TraR/DksA C4-type zinc finger protein [Leucobacter sp. CSA2]|uniref:TraR/DksA C4-type zinc finger protein n=1 Tax=Leucobacter edaphi TaxID=2796472 RepID=A0A934QBJ3_9MICO|nr:TraR/DksA C4-type zinc finger protein [Leucobacter edaphi]MBK0421586.1 TraR/DksA C4-type zinc finger protein [Leucobacter edaphi]
MTRDQEIRAALSEWRAQADERVARLERSLAALQEARRGSSDDDEHDPEGVTLSGEWSMLSGLLGSAREDAALAEDAFRRLEQGEYGICAACGEPIPAGQLEVRPARERCVACTP